MTADGPKLYEVISGQPRLSPAVHAEHHGVRRASDLASVSATDVEPSASRTQYWTFGGVAFDHDRPSLDRLPLSFDLTFIAAEPIGWECAKTHGHVHVDPQGADGLPELYEVLEGHAAFLVQNLRPGPAADFVAVIEARAGECVVVPPWAYHVTVNLGTSVLVVADVVSRRTRHEYAEFRAARGAAYYQRTDGVAVPNPSYSHVPPLTYVTAGDWSDDGVESPLYRSLVVRPADFGWLESANGFAWRFPHLAARLGGIGAMQVGEM